VGPEHDAPGTRPSILATVSGLDVAGLLVAEAGLEVGSVPDGVVGPARSCSDMHAVGDERDRA
jgi:hypothetical protein